jgi:hypothetical protein
VRRVGEQRQAPGEEAADQLDDEERQRDAEGEEQPALLLGAFRRGPRRVRGAHIPFVGVFARPAK